jgi:transposase
MGTITMSQKEARRPGLIQAALHGKITNQEGARALGLSIRQFQRLKLRYRAHGLEGLQHGNRGRQSSRRLALEIRKRVITLLRTTYQGFNDHHFTEKLREVEGIAISRELVRRLRREGNIAPARRRRPVKHRIRRLREARRGARVILDGSEFAWFGGSERLNLLGAIDDATGEILALHFRPAEDLHGYTELLRRMAIAHGLPVELYGDRLGVFVRNDRHWSLAEQLSGTRRLTQFGEILAELAIGYIPAGSPQAKGRIERLWSTLQDRLTSELRLRRIITMTQAEPFLPEFIALFNKRFARPPRESTSAWRHPPRFFDRALACRYERTVARDNTVTIPGRWAQIPPGPGRRSFHRCRVQLRELLDGRLLVFYQGRLIAHEPPPPGPFSLIPRAGSSPHRRFNLDPALKPAPPGHQPSSKPAPAPWAQPRYGVTRPSRERHPWAKPSAFLRRKLRTGG